MSSCKTGTDIGKINGGGGDEPRRDLGSFEGGRKSERVLLQCLQCQEERGDEQDPSGSSLLVKDGTKELKNSREDR